MSFPSTPLTGDEQALSYICLLYTSQAGSTWQEIIAHYSPSCSVSFLLI